MFFLECVLSIAIGWVLGLVVGLIPGIHVNLLSLIAVRILSEQASIPGVIGAVGIVSMAISQVFVNVIPAFFTLAPEEETALATLPAYEYRNKGKIHEAVLLSMIGAFGTAIVLITITPLVIKAIPTVYEFVQPYIGIILLEIVIFFVLKDRTKKIVATIVFTLSGVLGILTLNLPLRDPLLPLFSGLFGIPMILLGLQSKTTNCRQEITAPAFSRAMGATIGMAVVSGAIFSILPGLGPSQAAMIGSQAIRQTKEQMMVMLGGVSSVNMIMSLLTAFAIDKARNGAIVAVTDILGKIDMLHFMLLMATGLLAASMGVITTILLSRWCVKKITTIKYRWIGITIITGTTGLVAVFSGWLGLLVYMTGIGIGVMTNKFDVQRSHMMGCLILPMIFFFLL